MKSILPTIQTARSTMQALYGPKENTSGPPHRHSVAEKETRSFQRVFGTRLGLNAWRQQCFRNVAGDVLAQIFSDESQREINTGTHAA